MAKRVFFIGGGNMATAIIGGLDRTKWTPIVCEVNADQRNKLVAKFQCEVVDTVASPKILDCEVVVFAVKPQSVPEVLEQLSNSDLSGKLVVSIMAGVPMGRLSNQIKGKAPDITYARTMPNTPVLVGKGVTGIFTSDEASKATLTDLFGGSSELFFVKDEDSLNKVTGISGSGPAYFFAFIEALQKAGEEMGLDKDTAAKMAIGTALGAAHLASESEFDVSTLRQMVTSKAGTTEAALNVLAERNLSQTVRDAAFAALNRAREMAKM